VNKYNFDNIKIHGTNVEINFTEIWLQFCHSVEDDGMRMFETGVLGKIFGPKREEVTGVLRRLHNEELHDPYCSPNIIRVIKSCTVWVGKLEGKRTL